MQLIGQAVVQAESIAVLFDLVQDVLHLFDNVRIKLLTHEGAPFQDFGRDAMSAGSSLYDPGNAREAPDVSARAMLQVRSALLPRSLRQLWSSRAQIRQSLTGRRRHAFSRLQRCVQAFGRVCFVGKVLNGHAALGVRVAQHGKADKVASVQMAMPPQHAGYVLPFEALVLALLSALQAGVSHVWIYCHDIILAGQVLPQPP